MIDQDVVVLLLQASDFSLGNGSAGRWFGSSRLCKGLLGSGLGLGFSSSVSNCLAVDSWVGADNSARGRDSGVGGVNNTAQVLGDVPVLAANLPVDVMCPTSSEGSHVDWGGDAGLGLASGHVMCAGCGDVGVEEASFELNTIVYIHDGLRFAVDWLAPLSEHDHGCPEEELFLRGLSDFRLEPSVTVVRRKLLLGGS